MNVESKILYEDVCPREASNMLKNNYSFEALSLASWIKLMDEIVEKHGSWNTRKNYKRWHLMEVA